MNTIQDMPENTFIHMLFLGLYLMKIEIPNLILEYTRERKYKGNDPVLSIVFSSLVNAPDLNSPELRAMVLRTLS